MVTCDTSICFIFSLVCLVVFYFSPSFNSDLFCLPDCQSIFLSVCLTEVNLPVYLSECQSTFLSVCLTVNQPSSLSVWRSVYLPVCDCKSTLLSVYLTVNLPSCVSVSLHSCVSDSQSIFLCVCLSDCQSIFLFVRLSIYLLSSCLSVSLPSCLSISLLV